MATKFLDGKGRVTLGSQFAGQAVEIDDSNPACILIKPVVMIPAEEAWLYQNKEAIGLVRKGLDDAVHGRFAEGAPDVDADLEWLSDVED